MSAFLRTAARCAAAHVHHASRWPSSDFAGKVLMLMYHRIVPAREVQTTYVQPGMYVTPETFERHLRFLTSQFTVVSVADLLDGWDRMTLESRARYAVLTFDDGWVDNYRYAFPLLRACRVPATVFLPTDAIGTRNWIWFDRLGQLLRRKALMNPSAATDIDAAIERAKALTDSARERLLDRLAHECGGWRPDGRRFLTWDEVREMSQHGISFGSHTCTHANLTRLEGQRLEDELRRPIEVLDRQRVNHVRVLAYPNGDHSDAVVAAARAAGYRAAVTTNAGLESSRPADLFRLRRIGVHEDVSRSVPLMTFHIARQARLARGEAA